MKKIFSWLSDTNGWIALPIIIAFFIISYGSVICDWNNFYSHSVHAASGLWHIAGWALTGVMVYLFIRALGLGNATTGDIILIGVALVLALCSFTGFTFQ